MGRMKVSLVHIILGAFGFTSLCASCKVLKESPYAQYNNVDLGFYQYFSNDSLQLSIQFKGGHLIQSLPLSSLKKYSSPVLFKFLKRDVRRNSSPSLLLYSHSNWKSFGYEYIGIIQKKKKYKPENGVKIISEFGSSFFIEKARERVDSFLLTKYIVPLKNDDLLLYFFYKILTDDETDSLILQNNSLSELMTLKTNNSYDGSARQYSLIDSALLFSSLPGYGTPLKKLQELRNRAAAGTENAIINQFLLTALANMDETTEIRKLLFEQHKKKEDTMQEKKRDTMVVHNQNAFNKVLEAAGKNKVLMINESHYDWRHRYFVTLLLDSLYKIGYRHLAMEGVSNDGQVLNKGYLLTDKSGPYFKEPFMAQLARTALKKGFDLIPYEDTTSETAMLAFSSPVDKREYNQALNLYRQFKKDTLSGWIVYAGYGHINKERFSEKDSSTMARYFYQLSGISPVSVNQTLYSDLFSVLFPYDPDTASDGYYYLRPDQIDDSLLFKQSDIYITNNLKTVPYENKLSPQSSFVNYTYDVSQNIVEEGNYILKIYIKPEYLQDKDCVPIFIKRVREKDGKRDIWLPGGEYLLIITNEDDRILATEEITEKR